MKYLKIYTDSISDGPGVRISVYFAGCLPNKCKAGNCPGCHNKEAQNFNSGAFYTNMTRIEILKLLDNQYIAGLTLVGGEPFDQDLEEILELVRDVKLFLKNKTVWVYTGYEFKDFMPGGKKFSNTLQEILKCIDVLVVGPFILEQRDISDANRWRGSRNQRVINVQESLKSDKIVYLEDIPNNE